jgi:hypothetical protein
MTLDASTSVVAVSGHLAALAAGELVILHATQGKYYGLNSVGARVWDLIKLPRTASEIATVLSAEFDVQEEQACQDVLQVLDELLVQGLVQIQQSAEPEAGS